MLYINIFISQYFVYLSIFEYLGIWIDMDILFELRSPLDFIFSLGKKLTFPNLLIKLGSEIFILGYWFSWSCYLKEYVSTAIWERSQKY